MRILVTAGGLSEAIDTVRKITNTSTGRLGACIAEAFCALPDLTHLRYICAPEAIRPGYTKAVQVQEVVGAAALQEAMRSYLSEYPADAVIHCMAVSDYAVHSVWAQDTLLDSMLELFSDASFAAAPYEDRRIQLQKMLRASSEIDRMGKIDSKMEGLLLQLTKNPKILSQIRQWAPQTVLVGFKLLDHVTTDELLQAAYHQMQAADCDFVLANDLQHISGDRHSGHLLDRRHQERIADTKEEIAALIVQAVQTEMRKRKER
ncbi:MAG: phosphopantothenoylcysteine decarboxylase [Lachnospiraceae bacterium]